MSDSADSKSSHRVYMIVFSTYLFSFSNDAAISWSAPVLPQLRLDDLDLNPLGVRITRDQESWLASVFSLGNMAGLLPYGYLCYKFGRKYTLTSLGVIHIIAFLLLNTKSLTCFYVARFLNGIASGAGFIIFPVYISEICKDADRGTLVVSRQIFSCCGTLFSYIAGNYLPLYLFNILLCIFPILYIISFITFATESPYFYVIKDDLVTARKVLVTLTNIDNEQTDEDIDEILKSVEISQMENLKETLALKPVQKAIILVYVIFIFQHLTGYMAFVTYTEVILERTSSVDVKISTIFIGIILLIGSTLSTILIDRQGRKVLLYISLTGVIFVELMFSSHYFYFESWRYIPAICLTGYFLLFNIGVVQIPQIICAEIVPVSIKFKVATTAGILGCGTGFLVTKWFLHLNYVIGYGWTMLGFACCSVLFLIIVAIFLPETKGRSFRQIQSMLETDMEMTNVSQ